MAAAEILKERGAYKIFVLATHGLLSSDAPRLIEDSAIDEVRLNCEKLSKCSLRLFLIRRTISAQEFFLKRKKEVVRFVFKLKIRI